ncbi:OCIA domain containing protein [Trichuris trichiura]|uniref:OCIA domain containing protein n=1 Tax=Trichuris trichiura TaxID=36087 RepID=A0A077Z9U8_TRITR|nr:OCIA domain containing protein [Trichuris trichiura]
MESTAGSAGINIDQVAGASPVMVENQQQQADSMTPPRLSFEELAVLRECARESFFYRCVPLAAASCLALKYLQVAGVIKAHPVYGLSLKYAAAVGIGYLIGKLSYVQECQKKILSRLPSSNLAQALLRKGGGQFPRVGAFMMQGPNNALPVDSEVSTATSQQSTDDYSFYNPDFSMTKPADDSEEGQEKRGAKGRTNYDDLRMANRRDFLQSYAQSGMPGKSDVFQPSVHPEKDRQGGAGFRGLKQEGEPPLQQKHPSGKYGDEGFN